MLVDHAPGPGSVKSHVSLISCTMITAVHALQSTANYLLFCATWQKKSLIIRAQKLLVVKTDKCAY